MYPSLLVAGGVTTLAWDNRHRLFSSLTSRFPVRRPSLLPPAQEDSEAIELSDRPATRLNDKSIHDTAVTHDIPDVSHHSDIDPSSSSMRQRPAPSVRSLNSITEHDLPNPSERTPLITLHAKPAIATAVAFVIIVITLVIIRATVKSLSRPFDFFVNMIIAGIIIFGGGPVVIPLLRGYTVDNGWVSSRDFLLGFAILQAFPGPNFNFAVYLGMLAVPSAPVLGAFLGFLGIFSPGITLKLALLPLYKSWRSHEVAKSVLRGLNASAVGLIYTAVWQLFLVGYIHTSASGPSLNATSSATVSGPLTADPWWGVIAAGAFTATEWFGSPPPVSISLGALGGVAWYGVVNR
jgi:chromate transport protein ChrA